MARTLAVDPGEVRIGIAMTDPTNSIAQPLTVLSHRSRSADAAAICALAHEVQAALILVGMPLDAEGRVGPQARRSHRLVEALRSVCDLPIETWDESETTQRALKLRRGDRETDARAAAFLLQDFVDARTGWDWREAVDPRKQG